MSNIDSHRAAVTDGLKNSVLQMLGSMALVEVACTGVTEVEAFSVSGPATGLMVLVGEHKTIVAVCMPERLLREFVAGITGSDSDALDARDLGDGIGEMINMICGGMKTQLADSDLELLPPMTILGDAYGAQWTTDINTIVLEFETDGMVFTVHACTL